MISNIKETCFLIMHLLKDNFFYHSLGVEDERRVLAEEQKFIRARVRRFSHETNRRRKALEERQIQWRAQEQRHREDVLEQRRQRIQEATERFQRAPVPPSHGRRLSFWKKVPDVDQALHHIQYTSWGPQAAILFSNSTTSRNNTLSPNPPVEDASSYQRALSAVGNTGLPQDPSPTLFKNNQEAPEGPSLSERCLRDTNLSESLSSLDSLENEKDTRHAPPDLALEPSHLSTRHVPPDLALEPSHLSFSLHPKAGPTDTRIQNGYGPSPDPAFFSGPGREEREEFQQLDRWCRGPRQATAGSASTGEATPSAGCCALLALCDVINAEAECCEVSSQRSSTTDKIPTAAHHHVAVGNMAAGSFHPEREERSSDVGRHTGGTSAMETRFPAKLAHEPHAVSNGNGKTPPTSAGEHNQLTPEEKNPSILSEPPDSCGPRCSEERPRSDPAMSRVTFIKGILKTRSKYTPACPAPGPGTVVFAKRVALAIRDSVELTREKGRNAEGHDAVRKRLRWLDEACLAGEGTQQNTDVGRQEQTFPLQADPRDHRRSPPVVSGATSTTTTPSLASAGSHLTKQAWADVGVHVVRPGQQAHEVRAPRRPPRTRNGAAAGPVSWRVRKGTAVRPQSAAEASRVGRAQAGGVRSMVPRPPPRTGCAARDDARDAGGVASARVPRPPHGAERPAPPPPSSGLPLSEGDGERPPRHQEPQLCCGNRGPAGEEKRLCLHNTPTDEEISLLWHGVRSALAAKEAGNFVKRRSQEGSGGRRRARVEPARPPRGAENSRLPLPAQPKDPITAVLCNQDPGPPDEGSALFQVGKRHAASPLVDRRVVGAMETAQTRRPPGAGVHHHGQQGLSTLSLEEQRILLSLDRLNLHLHCIEEHVGEDADARRHLVQVKVSAVREGRAVVNNHKQHLFLTNSHSQNPRRY